jgi:EAL domain-containing protein (putative c-di-GMP-specific phosphodiesterase class I)
MVEIAQTGRAASRDRLLTFAFAGAELLVEIEQNATITWAAGAFQSRFGQPAENFVGGKLTRLIASIDHEALARTLVGVSMRGHVSPVILHLNDTAASPCAFAALKLPGPHPRICVTLGPLPVPPPARFDSVQPVAMFIHNAETQVRAKQLDMLGLLDVQGWAEATAAMDAPERSALRSEIGEALGSVAGPDVTIGELADGRYGVMSGKQFDVTILAAALEALIRAGPAGRAVMVDGKTIRLTETKLGMIQAVRALRFALSRFGEGGSKAVVGSGFAAGLAGFISQARRQTTALRAAITERRFNLVFQPVVHLGNRTVHHYEALLRPLAVDGALWRSPQDFVLCAEALGLAEELDLAVLQEVITVLARVSDCSVAANISGLSMQSLTFRDRMMALLPTGSYRRLLVELTETAEIEDAVIAATTLDRLRASNIALCIDDFGAGAAAFRYLRDFRMDYVKIDGAYVQAATNSRRERELVTSMLVLARSMGAQAIAEMIETKEQARLMQELGSTFGQGWLFGKPDCLPEPASQQRH